MDYQCAKFSDISFSRFDFIARTELENHRQTETHTHTEADDRYTHATTIGVNNEKALIELIPPPTPFVIQRPIPIQNVKHSSTTLSVRI